MDISTKIANILANRKNNLPTIEKSIRRWEEIRGQLGLLDKQISELKKNSELNNIFAQLPEHQANQIQSKIPDILKNLYNLQDRFNRETINIGVSGQARVGKSTLLQSITGLGDNQIPTGDNIPVTAVKSQIFHSEQNIAHIEFHSFDSFRENILKPYHEELGLEVPMTLEQFKNYQYPEQPTDKNTKHSYISTLEKLKPIQTSLWSYESLLGKAPERIDLEKLREYVAYPTDEQISNVATCERKHLAVKDVKIYCTFPYAPVKQLGFIDLPGLGELSASLEEHHLQGVQKGVDFVILVKRPGTTDGYWSDKDKSTLDLLDTAKSFQDKKDFISILINKNKLANDVQITALKNDIVRTINQGVENKHFHIFEADASDKANIGNDLLLPVLTHLANSLDRMDKAIIQGTFNLFVNIENEIQQLTQQINQVLQTTSVATSNQREEIEQLAKEIRANIVADINQYLNTLRSNSNHESQTSYIQKYIDTIEARYESIAQWIDNGFGKGNEQWLIDAQKPITITNSGLSLAVDECNHVRVAISKQFAQLDNFFDEEINHLFNEVGEIFRRHTGQLLPPQEESGPKTLEYLQQLMLDATENGQSTPAENLAQSLSQLSKIELSYHKQLHPRVREHLNHLEYQTQDKDGNLSEKFPAKRDAEYLLTQIKNLAKKSIYATKKSLEADADFPRKVLFASLEQFEDEIARSETSEKEFKRLAFSYAHDLAPEKFKQLELSSQRLNNLRSSLKNLDQLINNA